jgi:hypothetical protein
VGYKQDEKKQTKRASAVGVVSQSATKGRCRCQGERCINSGVNTLTVSAAQGACHWPAYEPIRDALFLSEPRRGIRHATSTVQSLYKEIFIHVVSIPARCHSKAPHKRRLRSQPRNKHAPPLGRCQSYSSRVPPHHLRACAKPLFLL